MLRLSGNGLSGYGSGMRYLITGATGFIGRVLTRRLLDDEHQVVAVSRKPTKTRAKNPGFHRVFRWYPERGPAPTECFEGVDAIVHLAGEPVVGRWTRKKRAAILDSRVTGTRNLLEGLERSGATPSVLVSASAVGYYGDRGDEVLDEQARMGRGFLAHVCNRWEQEASQGRKLGLRVVCLRTGLVLGKKGGALRAMLGLFEKGLGGPLGPGKQWWPWIHLQDMVGLYLHALGEQDLEGVVNAVAPRPVRQSTFATTLGEVLGKPAFVPAPSLALEIALGDFSQELLWSRRVLPRRAESTGYEFSHPGLDEALRQILVR